MRRLCEGLFAWVHGWVCVNPLPLWCYLMALMNNDLARFLHLYFYECLVLILSALIILLNPCLVILSSISLVIKGLRNFNYCQTSVHRSVSAKEWFIISRCLQSLLILGLWNIKIMQKRAHCMWTETNVDVIELELRILFPVVPVVSTYPCSARVYVIPRLVFVLIVLNQFIYQVLEV